MVQLAITSDIVSILDSAVDKATSLSSYVASMQDVLGRASVVLNTTSVRIDLLLDAMSTCVADKRSADEDFFQAVVDNNDAQAASALDRSLVASDCVTQYRVKANALQAQYDKLAFYTNVLNKKYAYISDQEQNIVSYFAVLRPALLKNLTTIASELQSFVLTK